LSSTQFLTLNVSVVVCVKFPETPEIVRLNEPLGAVGETVILTVLDEDAGFVENAAVSPLGSPPIERFTVAVKPFEGVMVIVD